MTIDRESLFAPFIAQLSAVTTRHEPALSLLNQQGFLRISGADSTRFLQGQLTSDVNALCAGQHQPSSACTPKGRMYSTFRLLQTESDYYFAMQTGLLESTRETLGKYAVFFQTELNIDEQMVALGLSGENVGTLIEPLFGSLPENGQAVFVADNTWLLSVPGLCERYQLWLAADQLNHWWEKLSSLMTAVSSEHWRLLDIEAVQPELVPEIAEQYIPQHLNLPSLNAVSFRKGCYTGQEIVARMQNLGQLKSRTYRLTSSEPVDITVNTKLCNTDGKSIGEVIAAVTPEQATTTELLAVIRVEAAESGDIKLPDSGVTFVAHALPYDINVKAELQR